jgi:hypothetical protein
MNHLGSPQIPKNSSCLTTLKRSLDKRRSNSEQIINEEPKNELSKEDSM